MNKPWSKRNADRREKERAYKSRLENSARKVAELTENSLIPKSVDAVKRMRKTHKKRFSYEDEYEIWG